MVVLLALRQVLAVVPPLQSGILLHRYLLRVLVGGRAQVGVDVADILQEPGLVLEGDAGL